MRAVVYRGARRVEVGQRAAGEPGPGEVRIAVAGICGTDLHIFHGDPFRRSVAAELGSEALDPTAVDVPAAVLPVDGGWLGR